VLQHNSPDLVRSYIAEFVRILRPGGTAVFDMTASLVGATLPEGSHLGRLTLTAPESMEQGRATRVTVSVTNTSTHDWPANTRLAIGNHWCSEDGSTVLIHDDGRTPLTTGLAAGASTTVSLTVMPPADPGRC